jgi:hypothetical protein
MQAPGPAADALLVMPAGEQAGGAKVCAIVGLGHSHIAPTRFSLSPQGMVLQQPVTLHFSGPAKLVHQEHPWAGVVLNQAALQARVDEEARRVAGARFHAAIESVLPNLAPDVKEFLLQAARGDSESSLPGCATPAPTPAPSGGSGVAGSDGSAHTPECTRPAWPPLPPCPPTAFDFPLLPSVPGTTPRVVP